MAEPTPEPGLPDYLGPALYGSGVHQELNWTYTIGRPPTTVGPVAEDYTDPTSVWYAGPGDDDPFAGVERPA